MPNYFALFLLHPMIIEYLCIAIEAQNYGTDQRPRKDEAKYLES